MVSSILLPVVVVGVADIRCGLMCGRNFAAAANKRDGKLYYPTAVESINPHSLARAPLVIPTFSDI